MPTTTPQTITFHDLLCQITQRSLRAWRTDIVRLIIADPAKTERVTAFVNPECRTLSMTLPLNDEGGLKVTIERPQITMKSDGQTVLGCQCLQQIFLNEGILSQLRQAALSN